MFNTNNFKISFENLTTERCEKVSNTLVLNNEEYSELQEKQKLIFNKLMPSLTQEQKRLFNEYEELEIQRTCVHIDLIYKEALKDGFQLSAFLTPSNINTSLPGGSSNENC